MLVGLAKLPCRDGLHKEAGETNAENLDRAQAVTVLKEEGKEAEILERRSCYVIHFRSPAAPHCLINYAITTKKQNGLA